MPEDLTQLIEQATQNANLPSMYNRLIQLMLQRESGGNPSAASPKGALGLMQLMPGTAQELGVSNPMDPAQNIQGGVDYVSRLRGMFGDDFRKILAGYNAGPNAVWRSTPGLITPGNIDLRRQPVVKNPDGTISTVRSISFSENGREVLIPTISEKGDILSDSAAFELYRKTGKHLGIFENAEAATSYAQALSAEQGRNLQSRSPYSGIPPYPETQKYIQNILSQINLTPRPGEGTAVPGASPQQFPGFSELTQPLELGQTPTDPRFTEAAEMLRGGLEEAQIRGEALPESADLMTATNRAFQELVEGEDVVTTALRGALKHHAATGGFERMGQPIGEIAGEMFRKAYGEKPAWKGIARYTLDNYVRGLAQGPKFKPVVDEIWERAKLESDNRKMHFNSLLQLAQANELTRKNRFQEARLTSEAVADQRIKTTQLNLNRAGVMLSAGDRFGMLAYKDIMAKHAGDDRTLAAERIKLMRYALLNGSSPTQQAVNMARVDTDGQTGPAFEQRLKYYLDLFAQTNPGFLASMRRGTLPTKLGISKRSLMTGGFQSVAVMRNPMTGEIAEMPLGKEPNDQIQQAYMSDQALENALGTTSTLLLSALRNPRTRQDLGWPGGTETILNIQRKLARYPELDAQFQLWMQLTNFERFRAMFLLSGKAVTQYEQQQLMLFAPTTTDNPDTIIRKLFGLSTFLSLKNNFAMASFSGDPSLEDFSNRSDSGIILEQVGQVLNLLGSHKQWTTQIAPRLPQGVDPTNAQLDVLQAFSNLLAPQNAESRAFLLTVARKYGGDVGKAGLNKDFAGTRQPLANYLLAKAFEKAGIPVERNPTQELSPESLKPEDRALMMKIHLALTGGKT